MTKKSLAKIVDFEISFYEGILKHSPNFVEALSAIGDLYTGKGMYLEGLRVDERLVLLRPTDPIVLYNLSCSYSLTGQVDRAFVSFKKAIVRGYCDFEHMDNDTDLDNLRNDERFKRYYSRMQKKLKSGQSSSKDETSQ